MKSNELLPFSRNRYYKGKMLTSSDFEAEQTYLNNKRRFINQTINGSGIVCGLNVISLDDLSLMIESGVAIDDTGREIVVENSMVKKLSTIAGFENLQTNKVSLCIRYNEEEAQPVYAINRQDHEKEYEYNRIEEGYELFLEDVNAFEGEFEAESDFFTGGVLFENDDYRIQLRLPSNICAGHYVKLEVEAAKLSDNKAKLYYECKLQTPALSTLDGGQELSILLENILLDQGRTMTKEFWMLAQTEELQDTSIMLKAGSGKAFVNGVELPVYSGLSYKINIVQDSAVWLAARESARLSMEMRNLSGNTGVIRLLSAPNQRI